MKTMATYLMKIAFTFILLLLSLNIYSHDVYVWINLENKSVEAPILNERRGSIQEDTSFLNRETEIIVFAAEEINGEVNLNWQTSFEINTDYFTIERSIDISTWESIGTVTGSGNSSNLLSYSFMDQSPVNGISYYRIKQIDYDGIITYSKVVAVETIGYSPQVTLFPQPCVSSVQVNLGDYKNENLVISILNSRGKVLKEITCTTSSICLNVSDLNNGIYFIKVESYQKEPQMVKLVKN